MMHPKIHIACFVSSHGFGHAARSSAVMNAIYEQWPYVYFEIFTETPEWFFSQSLQAPFACHQVKTDVGLVQTSALRFDLNKTIAALDAFFPFKDQLLDELAEILLKRDCQLIIADISPLGIAAGKRAGITSVLIENFTWDWIYDAFQTADGRMADHAAYLADIFAAADHHIQTDPICHRKTGVFRAPPIARSPGLSPDETRGRLGLSAKDKMVLITMGGIPEPIAFIEQLDRFDQEIHFVTPGAFAELPVHGKRLNRVTLLPHASAFYHPDLVHAADAVVGKIGYSTLAEVCCAGVPFGYIPRLDFRESAALGAYVQEKMRGFPISEEAFISGDWLHRVHELLLTPTKPRKIDNADNGARIAALHICEILACEKEIIEVVTPDGGLIGAAPRKRVHGNNQWMHRVVHVLVFDSRQLLLLQKRSLNKRVAPGKWDTSVGGHVDCGESPLSAAQREMKEELGISPEPPQFIYQYIHSNDFESELVSTYICRHDGAISHNSQEIDEVRFWDPGDIETRLGAGIFSDNFEDEFRRYKAWAFGPV
jgi:isopentenyldiphosphate isomerase